MYSNKVVPTPALLLVWLWSRIRFDCEWKHLLGCLWKVAICVDGYRLDPWKNCPHQLSVPRLLTALNNSRVHGFLSKDYICHLLWWSWGCRAAAHVNHKERSYVHEQGWTVILARHYRDNSVPSRWSRVLRKLSNQGNDHLNFGFIMEVGYIRTTQKQSP